mmetsp:Transcript_18873/g.38394  ORF Transcript_18873/g.38394 Transcript_18873/m.38394 type:complete len:264 (-) Transcript_18873:16-807(-)
MRHAEGKRSAGQSGYIAIDASRSASSLSSSVICCLTGALGAEGNETGADGMTTCSAASEAPAKLTCPKSSASPSSSNPSSSASSSSSSSMPGIPTGRLIASAISLASARPSSTSSIVSSTLSTPPMLFIVFCIVVAATRCAANASWLMFIDSRVSICVSSVISVFPSCSNCFSNIFLRLMHCSASRFLPCAENALAFFTSPSTLRIRCSFRFPIVSSVSRTLVIAALLSGTVVTGAVGWGAGGVLVDRPKRFITAAQALQQEP